MLTTNTLMNAVEAALKRLYPGEPVYYDELPKASGGPPLPWSARRRSNPMSTSDWYAAA